MKKLLYCACAAALSMAAVVPCFAAGSPWDGTWKLDAAKSTLTGSTITITQDGRMYTLDTGAIKFKVACDGKDYPIVANYSESCTGSGNSFTIVTKINGADYSTTKRDISADGKTMTAVTTGKRPDGTAFTDRETEMREGSGTGMVGTWKETKVKNSAPESFMLKVSGNMLKMEDPGMKEGYEAKLDGTPAPMTGGAAPAGMTISNKPDGANKVVSVAMLNGKELGKDVMTLSADGKTLTDVSWTPGKESEKQIYVYEKQ
jgi:hypothetical protein